MGEMVSEHLTEDNERPTQDSERPIQKTSFFWKCFIIRCLQSCHSLVPLALVAATQGGPGGANVVSTESAEHASAQAS